MKIKQLFRLSIFAILVLMFACNTEDTATTLSSDAEITAFSLTANGSVMTHLNLVFFTIDQQKGEIYNADSLPAGTEFTSLLAGITFNSASKATIHYQSGDSLSYSSTDSIDFTHPFTIKVVAYDGVTKKEYEVRLNVHRQEPDSMQWNLLTSNVWNFGYNSSKTVHLNGKFLTFFENSLSYSLFSSPENSGIQWNSESLNGFPADANISTMSAFNGAIYMTTDDSQLFKSTDGQNWTIATSETGFVTLLGVLKDNTGSERLIAEMNSNNEYFLAYSTNGSAFEKCSEALLSKHRFPISDFATITGPGNKSNKLSIIGGVDSDGTILSSVHQMYMDKYGFHYGFDINNSYDVEGKDLEGYKGFAKRKGAMAYYYNGKMLVSSGNTNDTIYNDVFTSIDNGVSWQRQDSLINLPLDLRPRANASTYIDGNNFVWIFGGKGDGGVLLKEVWKGRINRLGFINKN